MTRILFPNRFVECPLCKRQMREVYTPHGKVFACFNATCMIAISEKDPAFNRWNEKVENNPVCPRCGTKMLMFFRVINKFSVCQCPKCTKDGHLVEVRKGSVQHMDPKWSYDEGDTDAE